ncbi:MAG TPA: two-component regulator propeller domain-containing protein, partial [Kofleriaceae bacterium]
MTRRTCCALAILATAALSRPAAAAPGDELPPGRLRYRVLGGADGLKNLVIVDLAQDGQGLLWLGTDDGVYRYDGARFAHFSTRDGLSSGLIYALGVAPDGNVCVGNNNGLQCWTGERFVTPRGLPAVRVRGVTSHAGALWVATDGAGLYTGTPAAMQPAPRWPGAPAPDSLWADDLGLVVGNDADVLQLERDGAWRSLGDLGLGRDRVKDLLRDRQGSLWIRTASRLWELPAGAARAIDRSAGLPARHDLPGGVHTLAQGPYGELLVATKDGVAVRSDEGWRLLDRATGASAAVVRTLLVDREQTLWLGSAGLIQVRGRSLIERHDPSTGLVGD